MKNIIIQIILISFYSLCFADVYYVSTEGDDNNAGIDLIDAWRTLTFAADQAGPGDTVYVKAGNYGPENAIFTTDGTKSNPILFEGYQNVPGDNPDLNFTYPDTVDAAIMPLLDGGNRATAGTGITLNGRENIIVRNFQIVHYNVGLYAWGTRNITVDNIITMSLGDVNASYDGKGIVFGSAAYNNRILNCIVVNAAAEGLSITGDSMFVENCKIYSDDNSTEHSSMDYYIHIGGNHNVISKSYAERVGNLDHHGHGIGIKGTGINNLIKNCVVKNCGGGFTIRHRGVQFNTFESCTSLGGEGSQSVGIRIRDGASNNTFINHHTLGVVNAIVFYDTGEDEGAQYAGRHNKIINSIFENTVSNIINFSYYNEKTSADSNAIINCVFSGGQYLFQTQRENFENKMVNSIVTGVQNYRTDGTRPGYPLNFNFEYTDFWNNGFSMPSGTGNLSIDPLFADSMNNDFHLQAGSPAIDAGVEVGLPFNGSAPDLGAFEFSDSVVQIIDPYVDVSKKALHNSSWAECYTLRGMSCGKINIGTHNKMGRAHLPFGLYLIQTEGGSQKILVD